MNQTYLNCPSVGVPISAEEFTAQNGGPGCGCQGVSQAPCGCQSAPRYPAAPAAYPLGQGTPGGLCQPMVCCCQPVQPACQPAEVNEDACCCKQSFRAALGLLCNPALAGLLDFDAVAFVTDGYVAGSAPAAPATPQAAPGAAPSDNLAEELTGAFRRFSPCSADLLEVSAPVYPAGDTAGTPVFTASQMPLCVLDALVIQAAAPVAEGDLTPAQVAARNFRIIQSVLGQGAVQGSCAIAPACGRDCGRESGEGCCCSGGVLSALSQGNLSRQVSLVAGPLTVSGATLLGSVGNVLVLANPEDDRIYFVCANSVQFIA